MHCFPRVRTHHAALQPAVHGPPPASRCARERGGLSFVRRAGRPLLCLRQQNKGDDPTCSPPPFPRSRAHVAQDGRLLTINSNSKTSSEIHVLDLGAADTRMQLVHPRSDFIYFLEVQCMQCKFRMVWGVTWCQHAHGKLFIVTNADGARNFKVMQAPLVTPQKKYWREFLPTRCHMCCMCYMCFLLLAAVVLVCALLFV